MASHQTPATGDVPTVVVTGGGRGIGFAVAEQVLHAGCRAVLVIRDARAGAAARDALAGGRGGRVDVVTGDLGSVRTTRACAEALLDACPRIDVLVHNAGVWPSRRVVGEDGVEEAFAVNHLAPFVLNHALEERLAASRARVVQVTAGLHVKGRADLERTPAGEDFHAIRTYATTKLCNLALVPRFADRWRGAGATINAVHPGVIRTGLGDRPGPLGAVLRLVKRRWDAPEAGARPVVRLALAPELEGVTGRYFDVDREAAPAPAAADPELAAALWSQALVLGRVSEASPMPAGRVA